MISFLQKLSAYKTSQIQLVILVISILVATQVQYIQHGWINPDSVLYLEAAKLFALGEWKTGFEIFPWPFYSLLIAATHQLSSLSIHHAAQLLNVVFFAIATYAFTNIILLCGGKQQQLVAGGLIFLSAQYVIGGVLEMLMRDEGFWAFFLTSLVFFIRYHQWHHLRDALLWQIAIIFAVLFRIEAILYLILLPLVLLFNTERNFVRNLKLTITAYSLQILLALAVVSTLLINQDFSTAMLGRLNEVFTPEIINLFIKKIVAKSQVMSQGVLGKYLEEYAIPGLLITFIYVIIAKTIYATGWLTFGLGIMGIKYHSLLMEKKSSQVIIATMFIALLNMALIITKAFVLSGRYVLAMSFMLMLFASFYFAQLLAKTATTSDKKSRWIVSFLVVVMALGFIKNLLPKQEGYNYQQDAIAWLNKHNVSNSSVFYDDPRMRYYADYSYNGRWIDNWKHLKDAINDNSIQQFSFVVINHEANKLNTEVELLSLLPNYREIYRTGNNKNNKYVAIYKKSTLNN